MSTGGETVIVKLPMNYLYLGAIHRALPDAKLLLVRRSPLDSCFAMYRTLFGEAYPFSYDFEDLGRYYAAYERLMNHWRAMLGEWLHEIVYEDLVREPAAGRRERGQALRISVDRCRPRHSKQSIGVSDRERLADTPAHLRHLLPDAGATIGDTFRA